MYINVFTVMERPVKGAIIMFRGLSCIVLNVRCFFSALQQTIKSNLTLLTEGQYICHRGKRKSVFAHAQNAHIQIILHMRKVSFEPLLYSHVSAVSGL